MGEREEADGARARLLAARDRERSRLAGLTGDVAEVVAASLHTNADDEHDPEGATIAFERSQLSALAAQARHQLAELEAALRRLDEGRYGTCERCGQPVGRPRLEARPATRTCIGCAARRR